LTDHDQLPPEHAGPGEGADPWVDTGEWLIEPQQERSRATLRRMLDAAETLMEDGTFERATVAEIVKRADTSVGAFYARFADKEALFHMVQLRFLTGARKRLEALTDKTRWTDAPLADVVRAVVSEIVTWFRRWRGVMAALELHARMRRDPVLDERIKDFNDVGWSQVAELLLSRRAEIGHPNPDRAARLGFAFVTASLRELIVFGEGLMTPVSATDEELATELATALLAYLTASRA